MATLTSPRGAQNSFPDRSYNRAKNENEAKPHLFCLMKGKLDHFCIATATALTYLLTEMSLATL
eukprot:CAMPEP_0204433882 /NCGR_PEP_ID=MMETSP0470-20130426/70457_1 /ASSEMBLY_ACC=CAM_ASM_000385 /TAXON_ID=2969 /ORGANISM="Oxyrrhis marina" /LENGTH=63 /DNA_ID=CAMNT_0051432329 /DNA_START=34 /DNA_END=221 /DNA_ORIENTATION=+